MALVAQREQVWIDGLVLQAAGERDTGRITKGLEDLLRTLD